MKKTLLLLIALGPMAWGQTGLEKAPPANPTPCASTSTPEPAPVRNQSAEVANTGTTLDAVGQLIPSTIKLFQATSEALGTLRGPEIGTPKP